MIIYFLESHKIYTYKLPLEIAGSYILFDYDISGNKRNLISVEAENGNWFIQKNDEVSIYYKDEYKDKVGLKLFEFYKLILHGTEYVNMYVAPSYDKSFCNFQLIENTPVTCGSIDCDITFPILSPKQFEITYKNGHFLYKNLNPQIPIYVNNIRKDISTLNSFDTIFVMGLKILILGEAIYMNNPNQYVHFQMQKFKPFQPVLSCENVKVNTELYRDFYSEKDYYFKTPVFQNVLEKLELTIAPPPAKVKNQRDPMFLTIIPSAIMDISSLLMAYYAFINISQKGGSIEDNIITIIMCVGMLFAGLIWPFIERFYERVIESHNEKKRRNRYTQYLKDKEDILINTVNNQRAILKAKHLSLAECRDVILNRNSILFSRGYDHELFLTVRLGIGDVLLYSHIEHEESEYTEIEDDLVNRAGMLIDSYKYVSQSPYTLSIYDKIAISFIGPDLLKENYMNAILLQLLTYHDFLNLKVIILTDNTCSIALQYLKNSSYCWNQDKTMRFFSNSFDDGQIISEYLEKEFIARQKSRKNHSENQDLSYIPYYLIICDNVSMYKDLKIIHDVLQTKDNMGFSLIMFDSRVANIPEGCGSFVSYTDKEASYFTSQMSVNNIQKFIPEFADGDINVEKCVALISNIPLKESENDASNLPNNLGFLEMNGVGKVEQLNCLHRWNTSNIVNTLSAPIGFDGNGNILYLDLHEKKHGPHGLIAGMTGSGKSEFIITYILSLAVHYSPSEVQFVLIDYKGGGLAGAFENRKTKIKLPHLVGTITNLDKAEMNRTLVSIKSELQRRQKLFGEVNEKLNTGTIDIYKYQRLYRDGKLEKPLSHLFIICDEFAELKAQQPDFMDELVSAARIGRSLGIHLILATQKPSGVVDEQIWSNSKFKVCCKVQTTEDSNEMIRKPDAAYIKEVGRFYLQVGYDEYFVKGQSAYTGMPYIPSERIMTKVSSGLDFINNLGDIVKSIKSDDKNIVTTNMGGELTNVLNYIINTASAIGFKNQQLWLDNISKNLFLEPLRKKYNIISSPFQIRPLIGEYDDPHNQIQGPVLLPLTESGNIFITGVSGSGKSTLLSTIIYSAITSHHTDEVNFYLIDLLAENLLKFSMAPQVGEVLTINDSGKIEVLFYYLQKVVEKRKKYYLEKGGSFDQSIKQGRSPFACIVVMINGFDIFKEQFEKIYEELFVPFVRDCNKFGITFIVTGTATNSLGYLVDNSFATTIAMKFLDPQDYSMIFSNVQVIPKENPGRGLIKLDNVYEFQVAQIFDYMQYDSNLRYIIEYLNKILPKHAPSIPTLPNIVTINSFKNEMISLSSLPIGIELKSACPYFYDFNRKINLITFKREQSIKSFALALIDLFSYLNHIRNIVLSAYDYFVVENEKVKFYNANFKAVLKALHKNISNLLTQKENSTCYIITIFGYSKISAHLDKLKKENSENEEIITLDDLIILSNNSVAVKFVIIDQCDLLTGIDDYSWYNLTNVNNGILIAGEFDNQSLFVAKEDYYNNSINRDEAIVIENGIKKYIRFVHK